MTKTPFRKVDDQHTMWFRDFDRKYNRKFKNLRHEYARGLEELEEFKRKCALKFEEIQNEYSPEYRTKFKEFLRECDHGVEKFKESQSKCNLNFEELQNDCKLEFKELHRGCTSSTHFHSKEYSTSSNFSKKHPDANQFLNDSSLSVEPVQALTSETNNKHNASQYSNPFRITQQLIQATPVTSEKDNQHCNDTKITKQINL
ncbi:11420_t:CDS:1, partial [Racocetra persica]